MREDKRRAFICKNKDCAQRVFLLKGDPMLRVKGWVPSCHEHGRMEPQANRPYLGRSTA